MGIHGRSAPRATWNSWVAAPSPHGAIPILHRLCMLTVEDFAAAARDLLCVPQPEPERLTAEEKHESLTA